MTQANLLERAKQGDPGSIAALINLTLQPKGITATAELNHHYLHVVLNSDRVLNQATLVSFVHRGLQKLEMTSIQTVRVDGKKTGEHQPYWSQDVVIKQPEESLSGDSPTVFSPVQAAMPERSRVPENASPVSLPFDQLRVKLNGLKERLQGLDVTVKQVADQAEIYRQKYWKEAEHIASRVKFSKFGNRFGTRSKSWSAPRFSPKKYALTLAIATLPAFLLGGVVAIIASYASSGSQPSNRSASGSVSASQMAIQSDATAEQTKQQAEVKKYLAKMNKAQREFYQKQGRFASNLEELERSAAMSSLLSPTKDYTYKLKILDNSQSLLTATPRSNDLKSFTGVVLVDEMAGDTQPAETICATVEPSKTPPEAPRSLNGVLQCPPGSAKPL